MFPRGNGVLKASDHDKTGETQYKPSVEDYFFGSRSLGVTPTSTLKSKSSRPTINRLLNKASHGSNLLQLGRPNQAGSRASSSQGKISKISRIVVCADVLYHLATFEWIKGDLIGKGSHGKVYLGLNVTTGEIMAVKQVELPQTASDRMKDNKTFVEALLDERETLKDLDHENIVQYLGFEENRETLNIFLQYVSGGTIGSCLRQRGIFREEVTKYFATQILEGLTYLHAQGIIHRDLKSENILVEESGVCKISDFGISKKLAELDSRAFSMMKGTSYWMAPEVVYNKLQGYDAKIDIWSVGCILFEMWTARRPWYNENNWMPVWHKLINDRSPPPLPEDCHLSQKAEDFRSLCFQSDPRDRPPASLLRGHRYLELSNGWTFPGMSNIGAIFATDPNSGHAEVSEAADTSSVDTDILEVAQRITRSININLGSQRRSPSPAKTMRSDVLNANSSRANYRPANLPPDANTLIPPRSESPPLVTIEPPGPRKHNPNRSSDWMARERSTSLASESSGSQRSSQSEPRTTRRLVIHNPDNEDNERPKSRPDTPQPTTFIYVPPPLPALAGEQVPYSANLAPLPQTRFVNPFPTGLLSDTRHGRSISEASGMQHQSSFLFPPPRTYANDTHWNLAPLNHSPSPDQSSSEDRFSDSDSDYSMSTWKKPPVDILSKKAIAAAQQHVSVANRARPLSDLETRPAVRLVVERLQTYFPDHNLNDPIIEPIHVSNAATDGPLSKRYTMKSVKAIAEEQMSLPVRRQTRLWDTHMKEIKALR
ncbi:hypothetical protein GALMADRAFT_299659 [Galerina marginata CBS 339.88]|uniref:Protein kinase domain-containing protein n=1 Tax=Galerina marginata (strain CBS 339.88) TaxID=685588 RepID=A0A067U0P7_GALM3|nr:hypothetical protein GALMADRAFT_299659 [Galerina marginata CBS 339.88]